MEKITFQGENGDLKELYVLEETTLNGKHYLLLTEKEDGDSDAYIFREESAEDAEESVYVPVEDDTEYEAVLMVFRELLEDTDLE